MELRGLRARFVHACMPPPHYFWQNAMLRSVEFTDSLHYLKMQIYIRSLPIYHVPSKGFFLLHNTGGANLNAYLNECKERGFYL
jgi:hypothetical protein